MALDHFEESVHQKGNWKSSSEIIADSGRNASGSFDCNICLECVQDPVVTLCGHLYCWPCIYKWLHFQSTSLDDEEQQRPQCPVCKSEVSQSSLVPLYGRGQTTIPSKGKPHQVGTVIPQRPHGPRTHNIRSVSQPISQSYHPYSNPYHPQQFNSIPSGYTSPMIRTSGSIDNTFGIFGEMIYARVFGNHVSNLHTYANLSGTSNPRMRRHLMQVDKSLSRISCFLLCCLVLCLLLFWLLLHFHH